MVPDTRHWVPGTWYQVAGTRYQVPWYQVTMYLVPGTRYLVPGTWYLLPGTRCGNVGVGVEYVPPQVSMAADSTVEACVAEVPMEVQGQISTPTPTSRPLNRYFSLI